VWIDAWRLYVAATLVAGCRHHGDAVLPRDLDAGSQWIRPVDAHRGRPERQVDHLDVEVSLVPQDPAEAPQHRRDAAVALVVQHPNAGDIGMRVHPHVLAVRASAVAGDGTGDVRPMPARIR